MRTPLDSKLRRQLGNYVEILTHTGQKVLDKNVLKKLKNICRYADRLLYVCADHIPEFSNCT
jgi:hypothetical protein